MPDTFVVTEPLYWIALNFLPVPLAIVRRLHALSAGDLAVLAAFTPGELALRLAQPPCRGGDGVETQTRTARPERWGPDEGSASPGLAWWERVAAGSVGFASPLAARFRDGRIGGHELCEEAAQEITRTREQGIRLVPIGDPCYPPLLACASAPPPVLSFHGEAGLMPATEPPEARWWTADPSSAAGEGSHSLVRGAPVLDPAPSSCADGADPASTEASAASPIFLSVVGSRVPSEYGRFAARRLGRVIGGSGAILVSGLARGIDAEAHAGALEGGGQTWAILGGGLAAEPVPAGNRALARRILRHGALVSEFPSQTTLYPDHFPRRNRIIAGVAVASVVVEAASRSGSLITARLALEEGRDVFAVPGRWTDETAEGTNGLLRKGVAGALSRPEDLLEDLSPAWRSWAGRLQSPPAEELQPLPPDLSTVEQAVLRLMRRDEPRGVDDLVGAVEGPPARILAALVSLELRDLVVALPGGVYRRRS